MEYSILVLKQAVIMILICVIGMICYKTDIITKNVQKYFSSLVLKVVMPCVIITSFQIDLSPEIMNGLIVAVLLSVISHIIMILSSNLLIRKKEEREYAIERFSLVYTNCGYMGIPLIEGVLGAEGVLYATVYMIVFSVLVWSHGVVVMRDKFSLSELLAVLKSPTMIAIGVGLILLISGLRLPYIIAKPISYVALMNTPLPMLVAGVTIAQQSFFDTIKDFRAILISVMRMIIFPIIVFFVIKWIPCSDIVFLSIILSVSCPTAAIGTLFAIEYNKNAAYASRIFAITTVASSITMPLIILLVNLFN